MELTDHFSEHLQWWLHPLNLSQREPCHQKAAQVTLVMDASSTWGWGGFLEESGLSAQGQWSPTDRKKPINCLEMEAVQQCLVRLEHELMGKVVLLGSDNSTVVFSINCIKAVCLLGDAGHCD